MQSPLSLVKTRWLSTRTKWLFTISSILLAVLMIIAIILRFQYIAASMPYPGTWDEGLITINAKRVLTEGDFNTRYLAYPSLPAYLTAAGFTLGYINALSHLELKDTTEIGSVHYPYYTHKRIVWPAKALFATFSILSLFLLGILAYRYSKEPTSIILAPLILSLSTTYFHYSCHYINVDILGVFFILLLFVYLISNLSSDSLLYQSIFPGMLCGLVISSKYHLILIIIPCILFIFLYSRKQRLLKSALLIVIMFLTFFLVNPYILLDFNGFLDSLAIIIIDYNRGRPYLTAAPGMGIFIELTQKILKDFGILTLFFVITGFLAAFIKDWKKTFFLISFPLVLLFYTSSMKAYAIRNVLVVYAFYSLFVALGAITIFKMLHLVLKKWCLPVKAEKLSPLLSFTFIFLLLYNFMPVKNLLELTKLAPDARTRSVSWIKENVKKGSTIIIPRELSMDKRPLRKNYRIIEWSMKKLDKNTFFKQLPTFRNPYVVMPFFCYDRVHNHSTKSAKTAYRLNNFSNYIDMLIRFPGNYRQESFYTPFKVQSVFSKNNHTQTEGKYVTGGTFIDKPQKFPCVPDGFPEISIGRLILPTERTVNLTASLMQANQTDHPKTQIYFPESGVLQSPPLLFNKGNYELCIKGTMTSSDKQYAELTVKLENSTILTHLKITESSFRKKIPLHFKTDQTSSIIIAFNHNTEDEKLINDRSIFFNSLKISPLGNIFDRVNENMQDLINIKGNSKPLLDTINIVSVNYTQQGLMLTVKNDDPQILLPDIGTLDNFPPLTIDCKITTPGKTNITLYYLTRSDQKYSERRMVKKNVLEGYNKLTIELPSTRVTGRLRLDPGDIPGKYLLHNLKIGQPLQKYKSFFFNAGGN